MDAFLEGKIVIELGCLLVDDDQIHIYLQLSSHGCHFAFRLFSLITLFCQRIELHFNRFSKNGLWVLAR